MGLINFRNLVVTWNLVVLVTQLLKNIRNNGQAIKEDIL
jgi:hypothetical protein